MPAAIDIEKTKVTNKEDKMDIDGKKEPSQKQINGLGFLGWVGSYMVCFAVNLLQDY